MPGIVGFVQECSAEAAGRLLDQMAQALESDPRYRRELHFEAGLGLGRLSLGITNPGAQPAWNGDRSIAMVMEGELFQEPERAKRLRASGWIPPTGAEADHMNRLFEEAGEEFIPELNGAFSLAIWDRARRRLLLVSDRLGLHPLYFAEVPGGILFSSGVRALLADPRVPRGVDLTAMAEFLTFDHVLRDRTFLKGVRLLPQGTILTWQDGRTSLRQYWKPTFRSVHPIRKEEDYSHELLEHLRLAVKRQHRLKPQAALLLSGGLDSRALLAVLAEQEGGDQLRTLTWGIPGCDDARSASETARRVGADHHFCELRPDWLLSLGWEAVRVTDGMGNVVNLHAIAPLKDELAWANVMYKGFLGDAMFGFGERPRYWADYAPEAEVQVHVEAYRDYDVLPFDLPSHPQLFTEPFRRDLGDSVIEDYQAVIRESEAHQLSDQRIYIDLTQRVPRMTARGVDVVRTQAEVRLPYCDKDLLDFSLTIPPGLRLGRSVMVRAFEEAYPELAKVPLPSTGLPMIACAREVMGRGRQTIQWHLRRHGLHRLAGPSHRPYKDYGAWFRSALRPWVEGILLDSRCLERGYFRPEYMRRLLQEHMQGADHASRLGGLITIEIWHRQFLD